MLAIVAARRSAAIRLSGRATPLSRDVVAGAVIGRGPDDGQAERHVDPAEEVERLDRDQRLVVIHAERRVVVPARPVVKQRIRRGGSVDTESVPAQDVDRGSDDLDLLAPQMPALAGMGVETRDREPRRADPEIVFEPRGGGASATNDSIDGESLRGLGEW